MRKLVKFVWTVVLALFMFALGVLLVDKQTLSTQLVRLRVVAASDSAWDQSVKLQVRDAVNAYLQENMPRHTDALQAKEFLEESAEALTRVAGNALAALGVDEPVRVYLTREAAQVRHYDTFSLPSGVYDTLRVDIGDAAGSNWWCVVFPSLCAPATVEAFRDNAEDAGLAEDLTDTLTGEPGYQVRFFLLDFLGKIEIFFKKS